MLEVRFSTKFKKDLALAKRRGLRMSKLDKIVLLLADGQKLPPKCRDHGLENSRNYQNLRECHIEPDWLLVYSIDEKELILFLVRTGTHSDLF